MEYKLKVSDAIMMIAFDNGISKEEVLDNWELTADVLNMLDDYIEIGKTYCPMVEVKNLKKIFPLEDGYILNIETIEMDYVKVEIYQVA